MKILSFFPIFLCFTLCFSTIKSSQPESCSKTKIIELASGYILSRAIFTAAKIKVADFLVEEPCNIADLAIKTNTNQDALHRLLRLLASYTIFYEDSNGNFSLTPLAQQLVSTDSDSIWPWITHHHESYRWDAYSNIEFSIQTGTPSFNHVFGKGYFDFIAQYPLLAQSFDEGMRNISAGENECITNAYNFSSHATIVDIGGGTGGLLAEIVDNNSQVQAFLFDLPHVQPSALRHLQSLCNKDNNITFVESQGFFDPIPCNADLYILKRILHDWNDHDCITILNNCYHAMPDNARLVIIEAIVAEGNTRDIAKDIDFEMMILFGGKERTQKEWAILLDKANFEITNIYPTSSLLSIIEIKKK